MVDHNTTTLFNDMYDSTNRKVLGYITARCGNTADIRDIFQETYMELYRVLLKRGPDYIENGEAFVMKLARQKVFRYYSLLDRLKNIIPLYSKNEEGDEVSPAELEPSELSVEESVSDEVLADDLRKIISTKPVETRKIFHLYYSLDMTIPEIARLLSVSESHVKNRLFRTLKELRGLYFEKDG